MKTKFSLLAAFILLISCQYALAFTPSDNEVNSWVGTPVAGFIENKGQLCDVNYNPAPYLLFKLQDRGTDIYITDRGLSYVFKFSEEKPQNIAAGDKDKPGFPDDKLKPKDIMIHYCRADMELVGADIKKENIIKEYESTDYFNYYLSHCPDGVTEVRSYGKITIKEVYPGIDWVIYNTASGGMKYDFVVHPYADPSQIKLRYKWTDKPQENIMENEGSVKIATPLGKITEGKPYGFNSGNAVDVSYNIEDMDISFQTGEYNPAETLIIDPQLLWATYYGGSGSNAEYGKSIHSDGTSVWVTGYTASTNFPLQNLSGAYNQGTYGGGTYDAFILKFSTTGERAWATYYGGSAIEYCTSIHSDGTSVWVTGYTYSTDFPLQSLSGAYNQGTHGGGYTDAFILKFSTSGERQWATYYGGTGGDQGNSIYSDGTSVWVTGETSSTNFPLQNLSGAYNQGTSGGSNDAFILKFLTSGVRQWATYYGGTGYDYGYSIHSDGTSVWVTGYTGSTDFPLQSLSGAYNQGTHGGGTNDAFILKFSTTGERAWATYYGGSANEYSYSIHSDGTSVWVTGYTASTNFPLQNLSGAYNQGTYGGGTYDAFILKFSTSGVRQWATYYGGNSDDRGYSIHSDGTSVWVTGSTASTDFPLQTLSGAYNQGTYGGGYTDAFILKFSILGVRHWATYYGGTGEDLGNSHSDGTSVWVTGTTTSTNFPLQSLSGAYNQGTLTGYSDAFILKFTAAITGINLISNEIPSSYSLSQNYPNPFNPSTVVRFQLSVVSNVVLKVYDVMGREVQTLVNEKLSAGTYEVTFDGSNIPSGVYFYKMQTGDFSETKKMILMK
jgi:G:T/U-mismatch repair DNA glycosylase